MEYTLIQDTVETYGEKIYNGAFIFTIKRSLLGNLSEGFVIRQLKGDSEGWTYDETSYYVMPLFTDNYDRVFGWTFFKLVGDERPDQSNIVQELTFTNSYNAKKPEDGTIRVEIPYILTVKKTGEVDPTKETFRFVIDDFGAPVEYTLIQDTIETDGERTYNGMFIFTIKESLSGNLSEGFVIRQVKGDAEGWTYDETKFYAIPLFVDSYESVRGWSFLKFDQNASSTTTTRSKKSASPTAIMPKSRSTLRSRQTHRRRSTLRSCRSLKKPRYLRPETTP